MKPSLMLANELIKKIEDSGLESADVLCAIQIVNMVLTRDWHSQQTAAQFGMQQQIQG